MKNKFFIFLIGLCLLSCDKIENPYPTSISTQLDYTLYPGGDSIAYANSEWPVFSVNNSSLRNVMLEDFTGHRCTFCPIAADTAHSIYGDYPQRVFVSTIHAGPEGLGSFQSVSSSYPIDWTNTSGLAIGEHFGSMPGSAFIGNPRGTINRILNGGQHTAGVNDWRNYTQAAMATNLKVNLQAEINYYPSTGGVFIHSEIDILDQSINVNDLYTVVILIEDSVIGKQKMPDNSTDPNYIHRDIMRGSIGSFWQGNQLTVNQFNNGKYYFNYSYALPSQYDDSNVHLLIYVRDAITEEVYQVIKKKIE